MCAWIRACGGGSSKSKEKFYIVKDGQLVDGFNTKSGGFFDNGTSSGYRVIEFDYSSGGVAWSVGSVNSRYYKKLYAEVYNQSGKGMKAGVTLADGTSNKSETWSSSLTTIGVDLLEGENYALISSTTNGKHYIRNMWFEPK